MQRGRFVSNEIKKSGPSLEKSLTGIAGLDEITNGGLPKGRSTLVCGAAGCGKTVLAMQFLVNGAIEYNETGVFMAFEETETELAQNFDSLGFDLEELVKQKKLVLEHIHLERSEIEETGEYDLEGLFVRLAYAIDTIGAQRVVMDTIESLFSGLQNESILRAEIRRLFRWLKDRGITSIVTGEKGEKSLTRMGIEEYISDCVIVLDNRINDFIATRRLRILKYRGSAHGGNEYPFLLDEQGLSVQPITSIGLQHSASTERVSSGIPALDKMLGGQGYYRGSSILVSGTAGVGKSTIAAYFAYAACMRGERCCYFSMEESAAQIIRNMKSIGLDFTPLVEKGLLIIHPARPSVFGLEMHLVTMQKMIDAYKPQVVVLDPITNLVSVGSMIEVRSMLTRLIDWLKVEQITSLYTSLTVQGSAAANTEVGISSLMDTWLLLRDIESNGERNRGLYVLKSRGMSHSNQIREFLVTDRGVKLIDAYLGTGGVLTGTSRLIQEEKDKTEAAALQQELMQRQRELECKREALEAQINSLKGKFAAEELELQRVMSQCQEIEQAKQLGKERIARSRNTDSE